MTDARSPLRALRAALFAVVCVVLAAVGHSSMSGTPGMPGTSEHRLPAAALLGALAGAAALAWAGAGRRRGAPTIAGTLVALQAALHVLFTLTGAHGTGAHGGGAGHRPLPGGATATAHHPHHAMPGTGTAGSTEAAATAVDAATTATAPFTHAAPLADVTTTATAPLADATATSALDSAVAQLVDSATASGPGMLAAHLLAALLCGLWLARGEAAFFTLARAALAHAFTPLRLLRALVRVPDAPRRPVRRARRDARRPHAVVLAHTLSRRGPPRPSARRATALGAHV